MRILFLGDSLGLPRPHFIKEYDPKEKELAVAYGETYSSLVERDLLNTFKFDPYIEVINRSRRAYTIREVSKEFSDHLFFFEPDIIVLQVGIVDCWFRENRKQLVNRSDYEKYLSFIISLLNKRSTVRLVIVSIAATSKKMDSRNRGLNEEIKFYNEILKSVVNNQNTFYIDIHQYIDSEKPYEYLLPDDHHLNKNGNRLLANLIAQLIKGLIYADKGVSEFNTERFKEALDYFQASFNHVPSYLDNLYNLLITSYQLDEMEIFGEVVQYVESEKIIENEIDNVIAILK